jgi:RNA polymerase sigma-70 factor (ECF subfamily)
MNRQVDRSSADRREEMLSILPNLRRFALSLAGNMADADDLLQSTVERLLERGLPASAELLPWSFKVCRNLWIDELRSRKVRRNASRDPALGADDVFPGEEQVIGEISLAEVQLALARLPEEQRSVLELVAVEGYSYRDAAEVLDIPIGTVMSRLARARAALTSLTANNAHAGSKSAGDRND